MYMVTMMMMNIICSDDDDDMTMMMMRCFLHPKYIAAIEKYMSFKSSLSGDGDAGTQDKWMVNILFGPQLILMIFIMMMILIMIILMSVCKT